MKLNLKHYKILKHLTIGIDILFVLLILFNFLNFLPLFWSNNLNYIFFFIVAINTIFLALKIKEIPENKRKDSKMIYYFSHFFILSLVIITLNQFLKRQIIIDFLPEITALSIAFGFLAFYAYRNKVEKEVEEETENEEKAEKKRFNEFDDKFPRLKFFNFKYKIKDAWKNKRYFIWILRILISPFIWVARLPYSFVKWGYGEGWWYSVLFILLIILFLGVRLYSLDYIDGSDNYNDVAVKALYENGHSFYKYSIISTQLMLLSVKIFGFNFGALKLPFILYSLITIIFIYFIAKFINKKVALLSMLLFAVSPWSIILSKVTRDYSFDCMAGVIILYFSIYLYQKAKEGEIKKNIYCLTGLFILTISVYILNSFNGRIQTLIVIIFPFVTGIFILYGFLKNCLKRNSKSLTFLKKTYFLTILVAGAISIYFIKYFPFVRGYSFDKFYFDVFFNPLIESPWQWFHNNLISTLLIFSLFLIPLLFNFLKDKKNNIINIFYSSFFFGLCLYLVKYQSHIDYNPTRYIYFLFPIYCIILAMSLIYVFQHYKKIKVQKLFSILIIILLFLNLTSFYYALNPIKAYEKEDISNLQIDNIGTGRFNMYGVVDFIKNDLEWDSETPWIFGGKYPEFIFLLDYPIDDKRFLLRENGVRYDVGRNMFVESSYFNIHELVKATEISMEGYFVTKHYCISDESLKCTHQLKLEDFYLYGKKFEFIKEINDFKIYLWGD